VNRNGYAAYQEKKTHTSPEFPYNTYLCTIPLDFCAVGMHWHEEVELIVIKKGEGAVSVDLTEYVVSAGDVVFVMSGQLHAIRQVGDSSMEYENILFQPELLRSGAQDLCWEQFIAPLLYARTPIFPVFRKNHRLLACIQDIGKLCSEQHRGYQVAVKGELFRILYLLTEESVRGSLAPRKHSDKLKIVLSHVETHYGQMLSIEEMAALCYYSKSYFMRFFRESMGMSFVSYLNDFRLAQAAAQLRTTNATILAIANACGFDNLSYFNRSFKKKYGVTPGGYRKFSSAG
jgi:AraC-like DNA-binding protein/mannose-6-phosphate isomerase-like protein (cupin superfamily)